MNAEENIIYDLIERYLDQKMEGEELISFEHRISLDETLSKKLEVVKHARDLVIFQKLHLLRNVIELEKVKYENRSTHLNSWIGYGLMIFSLVGLIIVSTKENTRKQPVFDKKINFAEHISAPDSQQYIKKDASSGNRYVPDIVKKTVLLKPERHAPVPERPIAYTKTEIDTVMTSEKPLPVPETEETMVHPVEVRKENSVTLPEDLCKNGISDARIHTSATCSGKEEGEIHVEQVSGGQAPYRYTLNQSTAQKEELFSSLGKGSYTVTISDKNGCQKTFKNIYIADKDCRKHYEFNPLAGQEWQVPAELGFGVLTVYDRSGKMYYKKRIQEGSQESWAGESSSGEVTPGYYLFVLQHDNGKMEQGSITISR